MVLEILRKVLTIVQTLLQARVSDVTSHDDGAVQAETCGNRVFGEFFENLGHRLVQVDLHSVALACIAELCRDESCRIVIELLDPDTVFIDLGLDVAVSRAAYAKSDRAACTMTRKPYDTDVVSEVFAAELCAEADFV